MPKRKTNGSNHDTGDSREVVAKKPIHDHLFKQGNQVGVGNKNNRKKRFLTQALIAELHEVDPKTRQHKFRALVKELVNVAVGGDLTAIAEIFNRVEGRATQAVEVSARGAIGVITAETTLKEAAQIYAQNIREIEDSTLTDEERMEIEGFATEVRES